MENAVMFFQENGNKTQRRPVETSDPYIYYMCIIYTFDQFITVQL